MLRKGNEPIFVCMWINMLMLYEIYVFATGAEEFPGEEEPDPNDFNDNAEYEVAMKEYNALGWWSVELVAVVWLAWGAVVVCAVDAGVCGQRFCGWRVGGQG